MSQVPRAKLTAQSARCQVSAVRSNRVSLDSGKKSQKRKYGVGVSHGMMGREDNLTGPKAL